MCLSRRLPASIQNVPPKLTLVAVGQLGYSATFRSLKIGQAGILVLGHGADRDTQFMRHLAFRFTGFEKENNRVLAVKREWPHGGEEKEDGSEPKPVRSSVYR